MAARRCSLHNIDYPNYYNRCMVPGCDEDLEVFSNLEPDPSFKDQVAYHTHLIRDNEVELFSEEAEFPTEKYPIPDVNISLAHYGEKLWVSHEVLIKAGYLYLEDFKVVMIQGKFYELQAHVGRSTLTHGIRGGVWWIEEIDPDAYHVPDHIPEEVIQHGEEDSV